MSVVVGYVPDETGFLAVTEAAREATWRGTDVVVVNVLDQSGGYTRPTAAQEQTLDAIETYLRDTAKVTYATRQVDQGVGTVAEVILAAAEETGAELIVVGQRRRSAVAKAVLGSTAQRVLLGADCPVLSVRAEG